MPVSTEDDARALLRDTVHILRFADRASEVRSIARQVKQRVFAGAPPSDCVVACCDLAVYAPIVRVVFEDHGVPVEVSSGGKLAWSPVARAIIDMVEAAVGGWSLHRVLGLIVSDLVVTDPAFDADDLARWCAASGARSGLPMTWWPGLRTWLRSEGWTSDRLERVEHWMQSLQELLEPLSSFREDATAQDWKHRLHLHIDRLGIPERAARASTVDGGSSGQNLDAWGVVVRVIDDLARDLHTASPQPWPAEHLRDVLVDTLQRTSWVPHRDAREAVQIIDVEDLRGITPRFTWIAGLNRGAFPADTSPTWLVPGSVMRTLESDDPPARARYLFCSVLRNALDDKLMESLTLSWPATVGGRPAPPAPVLEDLLSLPTRVPVSEESGLFRTLGELVVRDDEVDGAAPWSTSGALRLAARVPGWTEGLPDSVRQAARIQRAQHDGRTGVRPGSYEGVLPMPPQDSPGSLAVTTLESYLKCPARYWYERQLGLDGAEPWSPEVQASDRGQVLHQILETFVASRLGRSISGERSELARELHGVASAQIAAFEQTGQAAAPLVEAMAADWLVGLIDEQPAGVLAAWLDHELEHAAVWRPVEVEQRHRLELGPVELVARVDRIDQTAGGVVVVDYKTGRAPRAKHVERGLVLQPIAYAAIASEKHPDLPVASTYLELRSPDSVGRTSWVGDADVLDEVGAKRRGLALDRSERDALLDHARHAVEHLQRGTFHPSAADPDEAGCGYCDFARICRRSAARVAEWSTARDEVFRPISTDEEAV